MNRWGRFAPLAALAAVAAAAVSPGFLPGREFAGLDWNAFLYPVRRFVTDTFAAEGRLPFWNPYIMGGMPHLSSLNSFTLYPTELLALPLQLAPWNFYRLDFLLHLALAGWGAWLLLGTLGAGRGAAFAAGLFYMLGGPVFTLVASGHCRWLRAMAALPFVFHFVLRGRETGRLRFFAAAGAVAALPVLTSSPDFVIYLVPFVAAWMLLGRKDGSAVRRSAEFASFFLLLAALSAVVWIPSLEYFGHSVRSAGDAGFTAQWAMTPWDFATLLFPGFFGTPGAYLGPHEFRSTSDYMGLVPLSLAAVGAACGGFRRSPWLLTGAAALALAFLPSTPLGAALSAVPFYGGMRGSLRWLSFLHLAVAVLAGAGWDALAGKAGRAAAGVALFGLLALALAAVAGSVAETLARLPFVLRHAAAGGPAGNALLPFLRGEFIAAALLALCGAAAFALHGWMPRAAGAALLALAAADSVRAAAPLFTYAPAAEMERGIGVAMKALGAGAGVPGRARVATDEWFALPNVRMRSGIEWIFGYHGLPLARYIALYVNTKAPSASMRQEALDALNVGYLISSEPPGPPWRAMASPAGGERTLYRNPRCRPRASFAGRVVPCGNLPALVSALRTPGWTAGSVPVDAPMPEELRGTLASGTADLKWGREELRVSARCPGPALLVLSEVWYPAWKLFVDGRRAGFLRAHGVLRAVALTKGNHDVRMVWDSWTFKAGLLVSSLGLGLLFLAAAWLVGARAGAIISFVHAAKAAADDN